MKGLHRRSQLLYEAFCLLRWLAACLSACLTLSLARFCLPIDSTRSFYRNYGVFWQENEI